MRSAFSLIQLIFVARILNWYWSEIKPLFNEGKILKVTIEGINEPLFALMEDAELLEEAKKTRDYSRRTEFIAPLDNLMWDRKLIKAIFHFDYKWEIYTPESQRKYGYYVLPVLYGTQFIGRVEIVNDRKRSVLIVKKLWLEEGIVVTEDMENGLTECIDRFSRFNQCEKIEYE